MGHIHSEGHKETKMIELWTKGSECWGRVRKTGRFRGKLFFGEAESAHNFGGIWEVSMVTISRYSCLYKFHSKVCLENTIAASRSGEGKASRFDGPESSNSFSSRSKSAQDRNFISCPSALRRIPGGLNIYSSGCIELLQREHIG